MLSKNSKVESIRRVPLFSGCSKRELADVALSPTDAEIERGRGPAGPRRRFASSWL